MSLVFRPLRAGAFAALAIALAACNSDSPTGPDTSRVVSAVTIAPSALSLKVGEQATVTALVTGGSSINTGVTWRSDDPTKVTVSSDGVVRGIAPGTSGLIAKSLQDTTKSSKITVIVTAPSIRSIAITNGNGTFAVGATSQFTAQVDAESGADRTVEWRSASPAVATINASGLATAVAPGQAVIVAMAKADTTQKVYGLLTIVAAEKGVTAISIAPSASALAIGETVQLAATVTAKTGVSRAVTFSSSNTAVATVSATGVVTAISNGPAIIVAKSVADTTMSALAAITVRATVPATVQITSINAGLTPVNPSNVAGQINVTLSVDAGDQDLSKVSLFLDNVEVASQTFTAAQVKAASQAGLTASAMVAPITMSINTAKYDSITGTPAFQNGTRQLRASLTLRSGQAGPQAQVGQDIVLNNANIVLARVRTTGNSANDANGFLWQNGSVIVYVRPVMYTPNLTVSTAVVSFAGSTQTLAAGKDSVVFSATVAPGVDGGLLGYQTPSAAAPNGFTFSSVLSNGNAGPSSFVNAATLPLRIDNVAPAAPSSFTLMAPATVTGNNGAWVNNAYDFAAGFVGTGDAGVGATTAAGLQIFYGAATAADSVLVRVTSATGNNLSQSTDSISYRIQARQIDRLGNERKTNLEAAPGVLRRVGIDNTAPSVQWSTINPNGVADKTILATAGARTFSLASQDAIPTGFQPNQIAGNQSPNPISGIFTRSLNGLTATQRCLSTYNVVTLACDASAYDVNTSVNNGTALEGYFTFGGYVMDRAGNRTSFPARTVLVDNTAPDSVRAGIAITGSTAVISGAGEDNVELVRSRAHIEYAALGGTGLYVGQQTLGTAFSATSNGRGTGALGSAMVSTSITADRLYRQIQETAGATGAPQTLPADPRPTYARIRFYDAVGNATDADTLAPIGSAIQNPFTAGALAINGFVISQPSATNRALEAQVERTGLVNVQALVQRVDYYWFSAVSGLWTYMGSTGTGLRSTVGGNSIWNFTSGTLTTPVAGTYTVRGIAVDANGNGLLSPAISYIVP